MATVFTKVLNGELPGAFVYRDEICAAFLDVKPINPGHVLLVPQKEVDSLWDLDETAYNHLWNVARKKLVPAIKAATDCPRVGVLVEGFLVSHAHIHLVPLFSEKDLDPCRSKPAESMDGLTPMANKIKAGIKK